MDFTFHCRVRGYELDSFGHVNNAVYVSYFEEARWRFLEEAGLVETFSRDRLMLSTVEVRVRYVRECRMGDELAVTTTLLPGNLFATFRQVIRNRKTGLVVCEGRVRTLLLDESRSPVDFPASVRERCQALGEGGAWDDW